MVWLLEEQGKKPRYLVCAICAVLYFQTHRDTCKAPQDKDSAPDGVKVENGCKH